MANAIGTGVGIVGTGFGRRVHYPAWSAIQGVEVLGIAGRNSERASGISRDLGLAITEGTLDSLISSSEVEIVVVAVPPVSQPGLINAALEAGKHVFAEKPLALTVDEAEKLVELTKGKDLRHGVDFCFRRTPFGRAVRDAIEGGRIGTPWRAVASWHAGYRAREDLSWNWKCDAAQGGGSLNALGVHIIDLFNWLFGETAQVAGVTQVNISRRRDDEGRERQVTAEDALNITLVFSTNVTACISVDTTAIGGEGLNMDIYGSKGALHFRDTSPDDFFSGYTLDLTDLDGGAKRLVDYRTPPGEGRQAAVHEMARAFVDAVHGGGRFSPDFADGLKIASVCQKIRSDCASLQMVSTR